MTKKEIRELILKLGQVAKESPMLIEQIAEEAQESENNAEARQLRCMVQILDYAHEYLDLDV